MGKTALIVVASTIFITIVISSMMVLLTFSLDIENTEDNPITSISILSSDEENEFTIVEKNIIDAEEIKIIVKELNKIEIRVNIMERNNIEEKYNIKIEYKDNSYYLIENDKVSYYNSDGSKSYSSYYFKKNCNPIDDLSITYL